MNNNPGVFTEDMPLNKKLFLFIFLLTICFQKNILRHDYLLADEVISHKKIKQCQMFLKNERFRCITVFLTLKRGLVRKLKSRGCF